MSHAKPVYDLMLLLDPALAEEQKTKILSDAEAQIAKAGELISKHDYGLRETTFEIKKKKDAEYHLIQFHGTRRRWTARCASPTACSASG